MVVGSAECRCVHSSPGKRYCMAFIRSRSSGKKMMVNVNDDVESSEEIRKRMVMVLVMSDEWMEVERAPLPFFPHRSKAGVTRDL